MGQPFTGAPVPETVINPVTGATVVTQPAAAIQNVNHFKQFWIKVGHVILDIFKWAPTVAEDAIEIIQAEEKLTPEFISSLKAVLTDAGVLVATASVAVADRGVNPSMDSASLVALETLVKDFTAFAPIVKQGLAILEGVVHQPIPPPSTVSDGTITGDAVSNAGVS